MPNAVKFTRLIQATVDHGGPKGTTTDVFQDFVTASARQLRAPYLDRHSNTQTAAELSDTLTSALDYTGPVPKTHYTLTGNSLRLWIVMPDQPFIVDTIRLALRTQGWEYVTGFDLMVPILRDESGHIEQVGKEDALLESLTYLEAEVPDPDRVDAGVAELQRSLQLCQAMVGDYHRMTELVDGIAHRFAHLADQQPADSVDLREMSEFLLWLLSDNFVFMGTRSGDSALGVDSAGSQSLWDGVSVSNGWANDDASPVQVRKGTQESRLHRSGRVDEIRIQIPTDGDGAPLHLLIQGLFTYRAVTQPSRHIPWLRRMLSRILAEQDSQPGSYRYKGIANVFDSLPTEFLFTGSPDEVTNIIERVLESEQQQDARAQVVQRPNDDMTFALVAMPKGRWSESLRARLQAVLVQATGATYADHGVFMGRFDTMLVHFYLTGSRTLTVAETDALHDRLVLLATPWTARLYQRIEERDGASRAAEIVFRYGEAFDADYQRYCTASQSLRDIEHLEALSEQKPISADLFVDPQGRINLRVFQYHDVLLSDMLPVLDDFGLIVIDQYANEVDVKDYHPMTLDTFRLKGVWGMEDEDVIARGPMLIDGLEAVFDHLIEDDLLNRVLLRAAIPWQAVDMLRAYLGYARQLGLTYTLARIRELLLAQPAMVHMLWDLFQARFDPSASSQDRSKSYSTLSDGFVDALRSVDDHDQDMVFRTLFNLIDSSLRTNFYRPDRQGWYLSFKVDCAKVWHMPRPRMQYEIYVHHRVVEGLHLRGGPIARGGIRWSDRSDYRQEILDLVNTQMIKNVLIVPEGSKGGFFMKKSVADRAERRRRADNMYEVLIRGVLDLTDNIVDGTVVHPPHVVCLDGEDPYLVVAADKGTAHLSDRANAVSNDYGFWLG
ncbi:MAG: NAD-glutamate dehydrogenase, partial [Oligoflexia bacterium]|nr:NAD-glutamate dehydrogenase [Oligoflexia bacterium]